MLDAGGNLSSVVRSDDRQLRAAALQRCLKMVTISSIGPSDAQETMRWHPGNDARVDLGGYGRAERLHAADDCGDRKRGAPLALASHIALLSISNELATQIALNIADILVMIAAASVSARSRSSRGGDHDGMKSATSEWPVISDISCGGIDQNRPSEVRRWANSR
ncbi:hypothetical protein M2232_009257 [Bradyrhizobium japonicum]|uniref:hypothetical protein n=1 Tax=Bradyrhizobium japonicum TaxID=375 RepID=UPI0022262A78|nr:hypothetical protein [Bradyrhizobium japonicum]MCW2225725.1 hypothetical protein [Bradyrhizobium japonicum]MCW2340937.1 hypothetical protein [Bradyrhizobium japonicum]